MALDLILRNAKLANAGPVQPTVDIGVHSGRIVAIEPQLTAEGLAYDAGGKLVSPGLIESHFHLDKTRLMDRVPLQPNRMVRDHMERTAAIKQTFTPDEMYARAQATLEQCLLHGVTHMRTQVEVDPNVGLLGFEVIEQLRRDYAWAIDLQPCVFLQEGWTDVPGADENVVACNVLNAFTPYGDCSLTRIANLYANVVQRYGLKDLGVCFEMITERAARVMCLGDYGEALPSDIIATCALPLAGSKRGRRIFPRLWPMLQRPQ